MAEVNRTSACLRSQPLAGNVGRHCLPQGAESPGITPTREIPDGLLRAGMMPQRRLVRRDSAYLVRPVCDAVVLTLNVLDVPLF
jgi:hypothetical protein